MYVDFIDSPIGIIRIEASDKGIRTIKRSTEKLEELPLQNEHTILAKKELSEYLTGKLEDFTVALDIDGYTEFQHSVWKELVKIDYGKTISYKTLAIRLGDVKKIRAAGTANGKNPIPIIIPCHRVIGSDGKMVGYSSGIDMKEFLLELEGMPIQGKLF
ncbi:methylated-DNA--[protein]-cysteine S-methyltransferase [Saprospiraceae bacterium]|nr:methylated-DNA--[protein]-cysteine S-methyltransferase [Saprospiraceae bacterium]